MDTVNDNGGGAIGVYTALVTGGTLQVCVHTHAASDVLSTIQEPPGSPNMFKNSAFRFGRGAACLIVAAVEPCTITLFSVLTADVVAIHSCETDSDMWFSESWLVHRTGNVLSVRPTSNWDDMPSVKLMNADNVEDVCFTQRYIVAVERSSTIWIIDTIGCDTSAFVAVPVNLDILNRRVVLAMHGFARGIKTLFSEDPDLLCMRTHALKPRKRSEVLVHGPPQTRNDSIEMVFSVGSDTSLYCVSVDPHLAYHKHTGITFVKTKWPLSLYGCHPLLVGAIFISTARARVTLYKATGSDGSTHQYICISEGDKQKTMQLEQACTAERTDRHAYIRIIKQCGAHHFLNTLGVHKKNSI